MILNYDTYLDKLYGCWNGKNIGGTLGAPFECKRGVFEVDYYTQELDKPLPNDDLDLQLVWLNAVEKYGRQVNSHILGEYWLTYIVPCWAEYGAGKNNLKMGLLPPLSGYVGNKFRDSNGSFILTEIWACLAPGHPEIATKYAYEDASVDHSYEGVYAAIFIAAIESAAFVISDRETLIDIGLSYLPDDSAIHKAVACARKCYKDGLTWQEARKKLLNEVPCSFGLIETDRKDMADDEPVGEMGYDAPCHMGLFVMSWIYGRLNFIYNTDLPHRAVTVYIYLFDRANKQGECWPAIPTIAKDLKLSASTVRRAIKDLKKEGLLETEQRYRTKGGKSSLLYKLWIE